MVDWAGHARREDERYRDGEGRLPEAWRPPAHVCESESSRVIDRIELVRSSKVRRAKLYYLRNLRGKAARLKDVEREHVTAAATR